MRMRHAAMMTAILALAYAPASSAVASTYEFEFKNVVADPPQPIPAIIEGQFTTAGGFSATPIPIVSLDATFDGSKIEDFIGGHFIFPVSLNDGLFRITFDYGQNEYRLTESFNQPNSLASLQINGVPMAVGTASISAVPLPSSAPMLGAALLVLGSVGYGIKRKKALAAA